MYAMYIQSYHKDMSEGSGFILVFFSFYASTVKNRKAFDGEVEALRITLKQLSILHYKFENAVLLSDSRATIQAIGSPEKNSILSVLLCREIFRCLLKKNKKILVQ
ncbi:hypothetical protein TNIN_482961 [Trichonephila inaurata madagascariensis]|uniref:Uncharacterized protein n=1 Tax=Trichonephila inaurata madagascariensis TaxID=2747483 RepID=A0A8X6XU10_9ARAC|nr:hypothetical protein TNIN_482961 [Trichonephila inaurata madagascariensis]